MAEEIEEMLLHEQVLLMALKDQKGTIEFRAGDYPYAVAGALLAELLLNRCLRSARNEEGDPLIELADATPLGEPLLDESLDLIEQTGEPRTAARWIDRLSRIEALKHKVALGLCRKGVLKDSEEKVLLFFTRKIYPEVNPDPEHVMVEHLRRAIFSEKMEHDPRTAILLSLTVPTGLLAIHFDADDLKKRQERIRQIADGTLLVGGTDLEVNAVRWIYRGMHEIIRKSALSSPVNP